MEDNGHDEDYIDDIIPNASDPSLTEDERRRNQEIAEYLKRVLQPAIKRSIIPDIWTESKEARTLFFQELGRARLERYALRPELTSQAPPKEFTDIELHTAWAVVVQMLKSDSWDDNRRSEIRARVAIRFAQEERSSFSSAKFDDASHIGNAGASARSKEFTANVFELYDRIRQLPQYTNTKTLLLPYNDGTITIGIRLPSANRVLRLELQEEPTEPSRIRMVIPIDDDTTSLLNITEVRQCIGDVQRSLKKFHLEEFPLSGRAEFLDTLSALKSELSWAELAEWFNDQIAQLLKTVALMETTLETTSLPRSKALQIFADSGINPEAEHLAWTLLLWMNVNSKVASGYLKEGLENARQGRDPIFKPGQPIDREQMRYQVEKWINESV